MGRQRKKTTSQPNVSRRDQFRRQQRASWTRFLLKMAVFVVPILVGTAWLIITVLGVGQTLPILTLDYRAGDDQPPALMPMWNNNPFTWTDQGIEVEGDFAFGGPYRNSVVLFCDILGDVREIDGQPTPCVFTPRSWQQHLTHGYRGLLGAESVDLQQQWVPIVDFLKSLTAKLIEAGGQVPDARLVFVLDVDHPDLPGRMPPQANRFIELVRQQWAANQAELNQGAQLFLWLSHDQGQKSYLDSDPEHVESFFKHRFELAITGDVVLHNSGDLTVGYSDLKRYLQRWVASDASVHKLAQTPVFLEPAGFQGDPDFELLEFNTSTPEPQLGKLFSYPKRSATTTPDGQWQQLQRIAQADHWSVQNPLALQRAYLLLSQLERLWLAGLQETDLYNELTNQLETALDSKATISRFRLTLRDQLDQQQGTAPEPFDLNWLITVPETGDGDQLRAAKQQNQSLQERIENWQTENADWRGALGLWLALIDGQQPPLTDDLLARANATLTSPMKNCLDGNEPGTATAQIPWNEVAFLDRIDQELIWPDSGSKLNAMQAALRLALRNRDLANQFAARISPVLTEKLSGRFNSLESQRRLMEDQLFAHELGNLESDLSRLNNEYQLLLADHDRWVNAMEQLQDQLLTAPHAIRYSLESLSSVAWQASSTDPLEQAVEHFQRQLLTPQRGVLDRWQAAGIARVDQLQAGDVSEFAIPWETLFPASNSANDVGSAVDFALAPQIDVPRLTDSMGEDGAATQLQVSDGNLLARRGLFWPGMKLRTRALIHAALASPESRVDLSRNADNGQTSPDAAQPSRRGEFLQRVYGRTELTDRFLAADTEPLVYSVDQTPKGDENFFIRVAAGAHHRSIGSWRSDQNTLQMGVALNDFRSRWSSLMFERTAADLWATPEVESGIPFVETALTSLQNTIQSRVQTFKGPSAKLESAVRDVWQQGGGQRWGETIDQVQRFGQAYANFQWDPDQGQATNDDLKPFFGPGRQSMEFALYPPRDLQRVGAAKFDQGVLSQPPFDADQMVVYLRGFKRSLGIVRKQQEAREISLETRLPVSRARDVIVTVERADEGPINGHVTLAIDCSASMVNGKRMERAKRDVDAFLEDVARRGDIAVSLVAFGVADQYSVDDNRFVKVNSLDPKQLDFWKRTGDPDVWTYRANGRIVNPDSLAGFQDAVKQLNPRGETPILDALDVALPKVAGENQNLVVLLTDGFEFGQRGAKNSEPYAAFNRPLYKQIKSRLQGRNEMVVFSYLPATRGQAEQLQMVKDQFEDLIEKGVDAETIRKRIEEIERLADQKKVRHPRANDDSALKRFFDDLLPRPTIHARRGNETLFNEPIDYSQRGKQLLQKKIGTRELPTEKWSMEVEFSNPEIAARGFANENARWESSTGLAGNELLKFVYDPFYPSFRLKSDSIANSRRYDFGGLPVLIGVTGIDLQRKPYFEMVAAKDDTLTPAPPLAMVEFQSPDDPDQVLLLQDFNLEMQANPNVHPIEFPLVQDRLRESWFGNRKITPHLKLVREVPPQLWSMIRFSSENDMRVSRGQQSVQLQPNDFVSINPLLPNRERYRGYRISLKRDAKATQYATYTIRVESDEKPLDRWLVNVVTEQFQLDRIVKQEVTRRYVFRDQGRGQKPLLRIEHEFKIDKDKLADAKLFFGLAHIEELEPEQTTDVDASVFQQ
jgi:hypothetical protein